MSRQPRLTFGLQNDQLIHISEVPRGLSCDCLCPGCGDRLIAKQGSHTTHHFAHQGSDCGGGPESALHLAAKEALSRTKCLHLPPFCAEVPGFGIRCLLPAQTVTFDHVWIEKPLGGIRPDLIAEKAGRQLLIEIKVTHAVDEVKQARIAAMGLSAVEIELPLPQDHRDLTIIEVILAGSGGIRRWLHHARLQAIVEAKRISLLKADLAHRWKARVEWERIG